MPNVTISTVEEFQGTRFGPRIVELTTLLNLPLPTIMDPLQQPRFNLF